MENKPFAREPLLYISQPLIEKPTAQMQHHYHTPKQEIKQQQVSRKKYRHHRSIEDFQGENESDSEDEQIFEHEGNDQQNSPDDEMSSSKSLKFKEMTLKQKIDYFINKPIHVPKLNCLIRTNDQTYKGIIIAYENNEVHLQTGKRSSAITKIIFDKINDIKMVGF